MGSGLGGHGRPVQTRARGPLVHPAVSCLQRLFPAAAAVPHGLHREPGPPGVVRRQLGLPAVSVAVGVGGTAGGGISIGGARTLNYIGEKEDGTLDRLEVKAYLLNTGLAIDGDLTLEADSTMDVDAGVGAGGMAIAGGSTGAAAGAGSGVGAYNIIKMDVYAGINGDNDLGIETDHCQR